MAFTITIRKRIEQRKAILLALPGGVVRVQLYVDGVRTRDFGYSSLEGGLSPARNYVESELLGGVVSWDRVNDGHHTATWHSDTVLVDAAGNRIQGRELDLARKALARAAQKTALKLSGNLSTQPSV